MKTTKKLWSMVLCVCLLLTMLCTVSAATEEYSDWALTNGTIGTGENSPAGGDYVELEADKDTSKNGLMKKDFEITPGKLVVVSFYYKSNADGLAQLTLYERNEGGDSNGAYTVRLSSTGGQWKKCSYGFVPTDIGVGVTVLLEAYYYYASTEKLVCYDAVTVTEPNDGVLTIPAGEIGYYGVIGGLAEKNDKIIVSGNIKAAAEDVAKMAVQVDSVVQESAMGSKSLTTQWRNFSVSGITYLAKGTALKLVAGTSAVSLQNVKFKKDANLLPNASFEDTTDWGYLPDCHVKDAADAMDGTAYACATGSSDQKYVYYTLSSENVGKRYLFSVWYKTNITNEVENAGIRIRTQGNSSSVFVNAPMVELSDTNGVWRKAELIFELPSQIGTEEAKKWYIQLGIFGTRSAEDSIAFDAASLVELTAENEKLGLYKPINALVKDNDVKYGAFLGEPADMVSGADTVNAVYVTSKLNSTALTTTESVVIAAYQIVGDAKQLVSIAMSPAPATDAAEVVYPTATLDTSELTTGTEIRAFLWDDISGLKPLDKAITTTK